MRPIAKNQRRQKPRPRCPSGRPPKRPTLRHRRAVLRPPRARRPKKTTPAKKDASGPKGGKKAKIARQGSKTANSPELGTAARRRHAEGVDEGRRAGSRIPSAGSSPAPWVRRWA